MKYRDGYKYQVAVDEYFQTDFRPARDIVTEFIRLSMNGMLCIKRGYAWDGPSGPTFDDKVFIYGSLLHDALYQLMRMGELPHKSWRVADREMKKAIELKLEEQGKLRRIIWKPRMVWVMAGLKVAKGKAAHPDNVKTVYEV